MLTFAFHADSLLLAMSFASVLTFNHLRTLFVQLRKVWLSS